MNAAPRVPFIPTFLVALAVAAMIGLGVWQLDRMKHKEAMLATYRANMHKAAAAYPANPVDEAYLFRTVGAHCLRVVDWQVKGGKSSDGKAGWRHIATCATGIEGPGLVVDMGVSLKPDAAVDWRGGKVQGLATHEPDQSSLMERLSGHAMPLRLMIVANEPAPGLMPSQQPDPASVPNNHFAYAVQWFLFAGVALIIYVIALRRRLKERQPTE